MSMRTLILGMMFAVTAVASANEPPKPAAQTIAPKKLNPRPRKREQPTLVCLQDRELRMLRRLGAAYGSRGLSR